MATKHLGVCPFCKELGRPVVLEENTMRRDKCMCANSECKETIYTCRTPGCDDYAKGGMIYDDELCPGCMRTAASSIPAVLAIVASTAVTILVEKTMNPKDSA